MITCTTVRFRSTVSLPGNKTSAVISNASPHDARAFTMQFDPRMRLLFVTHTGGVVMAFPAESIERMEFDPESYAAFRAAPVANALDQARKRTAAAQ
jgi:hypothetical protein